MDNPSAEFDKDDMDLIAQAQRESMAEDEAALAAAQAEDAAQAVAAASAAVAAPAGTTQAPAPVVAAPAASTTTPAATAPAAPAAQPQGDPRAALRHARHAEKEARERADRLALENAELRKQIPATKASELDADVKADLKEFSPEAMTYIERLEQQNAELSKTQASATAAAPAAPAFRPESLEPEVQEHVDEVPELLSWQNDPNQQAKWEAAKAADAMLRNFEGWRNKTLTERFAQAVTLVKAQTPDTTSSPSPVAPKDAAAAAIAAQLAAAAPATALGIGDLRGGATPASTSIPDYHALVKAGRSDEDIIAMLPPG